MMPRGWSSSDSQGEKVLRGGVQRRCSTFRESYEHAGLQKKERTLKKNIENFNTPPWGAVTLSRDMLSLDMWKDLGVETVRPSLQSRRQTPGCMFELKERFRVFSLRAWSKKTLRHLSPAQVPGELANAFDNDLSCDFLLGWSWTQTHFCWQSQHVYVTVFRLKVILGIGWNTFFAINCMFFSDALF